MIVYIDILIIENFIVNLFLLITTMKLLKYKYDKKIYISAFLGSIYTLVIFFENNIFSSLFFKILVVILMFSLINKKILILKSIKMVITFFLLSFTLSGLSFALALRDNPFIILESFSIDNFKVKDLILSLMIVYTIAIRIIDLIKDRANICNFIFDIELKDEKITLYLKGLLDTGNALREPVTNLPCILIENDIMESLNFISNERYYINFNTISENGSLQGIKTNNIRIKQENSEWKNIEAIICSCKNKLSKENEFNALLSRGVI